MRIHVVPDGVQQTRLARYLPRAWPALPGSVIREALKKKDVRINGARSGPDALVSAGDELRIYIDDRHFAAPLDVLYRDELLLVLDKPAGLPVDADGAGIGADTLIARARAAHETARLCHRLDAGTGGALLCSLTDAAHEALLAAFRAHRIEKHYRALVLGSPRPEAVLSAYLAKDAEGAKVRILDRPAPGAAAIETRYRVVRQFHDAAELDVELVTGRTHQIRAHLAHIGCPLIGDDKYGDREANRLYGAQWPQLWCRELRIRSEGLLSRYADRPFASRPRFSAKITP